MYLLGALVLGMLIPFLPIDMLLYSLYQEPAAAVYIEPLVVSMQQVDSTIAVVEHTAKESTTSWWWILGLIYGIGVLVGFSRFGHGLYKISQLYRSGTVHQKGQYNLVLTNQNHLPFSFFNHLFWSKDTVIQSADAEKIFTHEIGHINQWHSLDVLFLEILNIVWWFSPPIYWYKKSLRAVHEFLADACVLKDTKTKVYGQLLLQQAQSGLQMSLANHFLNSQLKKRIKMMTRNKSSQPALMKYLSALPLVVLLAMLFGNPQVRTNLKATTNMAMGFFYQKEEVPSIDAQLLSWIGSDFDKEKALAVLKAAFENGKSTTNFINYTPTKKELDEFENEQKVKDLHKACIYLIQKYPEKKEVIQDLTKTVAQDFGYKLRFHEDGKSIIYQSLNPKIKEEESLPRVWVVVNDIELGLYAEHKLWQIIPTNEIKRKEVLDVSEAVKRYGEENGNNGAILIYSDVWTVRKEDDSTILTKEETVDQIDNNGYKEVELEIEKKTYGAQFPRNKEWLIDDLLIYVNGSLYSLESGDIPNEAIETSNMLVGKAAIEKYGEAAKNGVFEIELKEGVTLPFSKNKERSNNAKNDTSNPSLEKLLQDAQAEDLPLYINGVLTSKESISISVDEIASINVLKGLKARMKYGEAVTNGVVEIQLIEGASLFLKGLNIPVQEEIFTPDLTIKAFHNPAKQDITLYFDGDAIPTNLKIFELNGRTIYKEQISSFDGFYNKTISLGHVAKGTLIIQFKQGGKTVEEKVIVE